jgi:hypothetical protein
MQPSRDGPDDRPTDSVYSLLTSVRGVLGALLLVGILGAVVTAPAVGALGVSDAPADGSEQVSGEATTAVGSGTAADHEEPDSRTDQNAEDIRNMSYGDVVSGSIDTDDPSSEEYRGYHEPITFDGSAGDTVRAQMVGGDIDSYGYYDQGTEMDPYLILVAPDGDVIARNDDSDYGFNAEFQGVVLPEDGEYTLVATSYGSNQTFDYTLRLLNEDAEAADLRSIDRNSTATGAIDKDDPSSEDRRGFYEPVTFTGSAGENVEITMGSQRGDTYLQLLDPEGNVIAENDDSGYSLNSSLDTDLPSDGEYTIVATSFGEQDTFEYELSLNVSAGGEGGADLRSIQSGQTRDSELDESDPQAGFLRGYYEPVTFDGESGQSVTIDMSSGQGDTYLMLYGPDGNRIAQNDDYDGLNSRIEATLEEDGEYTIIATSFDDEATFDYELSLSTGEPAEAVDLRSISYGETANGSIDSADPESQSYRGNYEPVTFEGSSGDNVTIDMTSDDDTYLILLGPDGTIVAENDDYEGLDSRIETSLPSDGTYTIVATSYSSEATFDYELTLERAE